MVSRRKILSRSIDDLDIEEPQEDDEDVWHQKEKLFLEHLQEVIDKWEQIDDEIWAKVIVFEKNRRVAKAYARAPVLTINNSQDGFDGMRIGLCGFDNPLRDQKTEDAKRYVGQGVKIKMDDEGNILIRRYAKSNVYVKNLNGENLNMENSLSNDILKLPNQALGNDAIFKLFDMKKFQSNINRELRQAYPDRKRLELQCLSAVVFVKSDAELLNCPIWVLVVNVVAMDMLRTKLPPMHRLLNPKIRPRLPIPEEDSIYGVSGNNNNNNNNNNTINNNNNNLHNGNTNGIHENSDSSGYGSNGMILTNGSSYEINGFTNHNGNHTNGNGIHHHHHHQNGGGFNDITNDMNNNNINGNIKNNMEPFYQTHTKKMQNSPKLPPRDKDGNPQQPQQQQQQQQIKEDLPTPDYESDDIKIKQFIFRNKHNSTNNNSNNVNYDGTNNKKEKEKKKIVSEDPYYCGLSARVPKYDQKKSALKKLQKNLNNLIVPKRMSIAYFQHPNATGTPYINGYQYQSQQQLFLQAPPLSPKFIAPPPPPPQSNFHHNTLWHARSMESGLDFPSEFNVQYFPFDRPDYRMVGRRPV